MTNDVKLTIPVPESLKKEIWVVSKQNLSTLNTTCREMLMFAMAKKFGTTETKKHHFLRQNLIQSMQLQDNIAEFDASGDQIKYEFAKKALILSGNFGIKLTKDDHLRYSLDLVEFLKSAGEIDSDQYESYVKILKRILSPTQFNTLKKLMAP